MKLHHPPHLFLNNMYYFLTARTYNRRIIFNTYERKSLLLRSLQAVFQSHGYRLTGWVILGNHYHMLFRSSTGSDLARIINLVHGRVSYQLNQWDGMRGRKIFQNYWDRCMRDEEDYYRHLNYIHHNPVKHGLVQRMHEYPLSSFDSYLRRLGHAWMEDCFRQYPVATFYRSGLDKSITM